LSSITVQVYDLFTAKQRIEYKNISIYDWKEVLHV